MADGITLGTLRRLLDEANLDDDAAVMIETWDDRTDSWDWAQCSAVSVEIHAEGPGAVRFRWSSV